MMNLRYHIVSLVAVFLALALGVIAGTAAIDHGVVKIYRRANITRTHTIERLSAELADARRAGTVWQGFGDALIPGLARGMLQGKRVLLLLQDSAAGLSAEGVADAVTQAGGVNAGRISFTKKWRLADQASRDQLALAIGVPSGQDVHAVLRNAAAQLAERLAEPAEVQAEADLLGSLERAGFVTLAGLGDGPAPVRGTAVVYLSAGTPEAVPASGDFGLTFVRKIAGAFPTAVAEPLDATDSLVDHVLDEEALSVSVATVDHVDTAPGRLALIVALRGRVDRLPAEHYGVRRGAVGVVPSMTGA